MWNIVIEGSKEVWVYNKNPEGTRDFVARFKYSRPKASANDFVKFLKANFTPAEYKEARTKGKAPLTILMSKGYESLNSRTMKLVA